VSRVSGYLLTLYQLQSCICEKSKSRTVLGHSDNGIADSNPGFGIHVSFFFLRSLYEVLCFISETTERILSKFGIVMDIDSSLAKHTLHDAQINSYIYRGEYLRKCKGNSF
jgi:hypothetical protein